MSKKDFLKGYYHLDFVEEYLDSIISNKDITDNTISAINEEIPPKEVIIDKLIILILILNSK